jgi:ABC-type uncharacterized transport system involved in gliding motility auxiliary subunit
MSAAPQPPTGSRTSFSVRRRWRIGLDIALRTLIVLAVAVMVNYVAAQFFHRFYLSSRTKTALSSRTRTILASLTNQMTITLYYDTRDQNNFYPTLLDLANEYRAANKNITVRTVDYEREPGEAEKAKEQYNLPGSASTPNAPPSKDLIIFACGDHHVVVPGEAIVQYQLQQIASQPGEKELEFRRKPIAFNGEVMFTSKLLELERQQPFIAYFVQGDGEPSLADEHQFGFQSFALTLAQNNITMRNLELFGNVPVPADCNLLILVAPRPLSDSELEKVSQYQNEGGRLLLLLDYNSVQQPTGLEPILQHWGINVLPDTVKDPHGTITGQDVRVRRFNPKGFLNPLAEESLQMIFPHPVEKVEWDSPPPNAPQVDELAFSSPDATLIHDPAAAARSYPLIADSWQKPVAGVNHPRGATRIVVAGDSTFLSNYFIQGGADRDFVSYAVNWLLDREELLSGVSPHPVTELRLMLTQREQQQLGWLLVGALPGGVLLLGLAVWFVRRK